MRGGIEGVRHGQTEAAQALGLSSAQTLRLVVMPQALRIIVPPMLSEYLALTKNTSLAIAIGYPELMSITNTTLEPDRPGDRGDRADDGDLSDDQPRHLARA